MRGIRARIGIISLDSNCGDHEYWMLAPEGVSLFFTRHRGHPPKIEDIKEATENLLAIRPNSIVYECTSGSFGPGPDWNDLLIKTMEKVAGVPATTAANAIVEALRTLKAKKIYTSQFTLGAFTF